MEIKNLVKQLTKGAVAFSILLSFSNAAFAKDVKFGKDITLKQETKVSEILKKPDSFVGKNVLIKGKVLDVCTKRGCWMKLSSDKKKESITIKVKDGEMVFPLEAKGKDASIEGELFKIVLDEKEEMNKEKAEKVEKHEDHKDKDEVCVHCIAKKDKLKENVIYMFKPKSVVIH